MGLEQQGQIVEVFMVFIDEIIVVSNCGFDTVAITGEKFREF